MGAKTAVRCAVILSCWAQWVIGGWHARQIVACSPVPSRPCGCQRAFSSRFIVYSYRGGPCAKRVADDCERLYREIHEYWFGGRTDTAWNCPCYVTLHPDRVSFTRAVPGGDSVVGRTRIRMVGDQVVMRRIDVLVDGDGQPSALAHEVTHMVCAERWPSGLPPRWLDEGMALLADDPVKQRLHWRDCQAAAFQGTAMGLEQLLRCDAIPRSEQAAVFYGQSFALVSYLLHVGPPERVPAFAARATAVGYDTALREWYGIEGVHDLEHRWRRFMQESGDFAAAAPLARVVR